MGLHPRTAMQMTAAQQYNGPLRFMADPSLFALGGPQLSYLNPKHSWHTQWLACLQLWRLSTKT